MADAKFTYKDYEDDDVTNASRDKYNSLLTTEPTYTDNWTNTLYDITNKALNREKFSYDVTGDALYQQYKDQYINQGKLAMMDTMGQAQAATGGYGNSYSQSVGQQAYQGYLQQLNDRVPELYQLALDKYNQEGQDLYNQYSLVSDMSNTEYGRYRDAKSDWQNALGIAFDDYWNNKNFGYGKYTDGKNFAYTEYRDGKEDEQTAKDNALREAETAASLGDYSKLKDLGYDTTKAEAAVNATEKWGGLTFEQIGTLNDLYLGQKWGEIDRYLASLNLDDADLAALQKLWLSEDYLNSLNKYKFSEPGASGTVPAGKSGLNYTFKIN